MIWLTWDFGKLLDILLHIFKQFHVKMELLCGACRRDLATFMKYNVDNSSSSPTPIIVSVAAYDDQSQSSSLDSEGVATYIVDIHNATERLSPFVCSDSLKASKCSNSFEKLASGTQIIILISTLGQWISRTVPIGGNSCNEIPNKWITVFVSSVRTRKQIKIASHQEFCKSNASLLIGIETNFTEFENMSWFLEFGCSNEDVVLEWSSRLPNKVVSINCKKEKEDLSEKTARIRLQQ